MVTVSPNQIIIITISIITKSFRLLCKKLWKNLICSTSEFHYSTELTANKDIFTLDHLKQSSIAIKKL